MPTNLPTFEPTGEVRECGWDELYWHNGQLRTWRSVMQSTEKYPLYRRVPPPTRTVSPGEQHYRSESKVRGWTRPWKHVDAMEQAAQEAIAASLNITATEEPAT